MEGGGGVGGDGRSRLSAKEEARRAEEEKAQQGEIMRLLTCLKTLGDENAALMKECEDRDKASDNMAGKGWTGGPWHAGCGWVEAFVASVLCVGRPMDV